MWLMVKKWKALRSFTYLSAIVDKGVEVAEAHGEFQGLRFAFILFCRANKGIGRRTKIHLLKT